MPRYWYEEPRFITVSEDDGEDEVRRAEFNAKISAYRKPYFMIYVYPKLKKDYLKYISNVECKSEVLFDISLDELIQSDDPTAIEFVDSYLSRMPVGRNDCVVNRICQIFENAFDSWSAKSDPETPFDYSILKSNVEYSQADYASIFEIYNYYLLQVKNFHNRTRNERVDKFEAFIEKQTFVDTFKRRCALVCSNRYELCDIMLDICYQKESGKRFVWDVCGDVLIDNLLSRNGYKLHFPEVVESNGEFEYGGSQFKMTSVSLSEDDMTDE